MEVRDFCQQHPEFAKQSALEPFYFCESLEVTLPLGRTARTLDEFRKAFHLSAIPVSISTSSLLACGFSSAPTIFPTGSREKAWPPKN